MASRRQKYRFYHFCLRGVCLGIFEHFFHVCKDNTSTDNSAFKKMQFLAMMYNMGILSFALRK